MSFVIVDVFFPKIARKKEKKTWKKKQKNGFFSDPLKLYFDDIRICEAYIYDV